VHVYSGPMIGSMPHSSQRCSWLGPATGAGVGAATGARLGAATDARLGAATGVGLGAAAGTPLALSSPGLLI
jgi:hypothetical protein